MKTNDDPEELENFFSCYFHQDWPLEAEDPQGVIKLYLAHSPATDLLRRLAEEIDTFAGRQLSNETLERALLTELGCYYLPSADKKTTREWLREVAETLRAEAQRRSS